MTQPLAIASYVTTYSTHAPYIGPAEYSNAPTAVDASNLVQGGDVQANLYELVNVIGRASAIADAICFGATGCLAATRDLDGPKRCLVRPNGVIEFPARYHPVLQVDEILIGDRPSAMTAISSAQALDLAILPTAVVEIPTSAGISSRPFVSMLYVNGYAAALLAETVQAGDTSINVGTAVLGFYPGASYQIFDDFPGGEAFTIADSYVLGSASIPLVSPLKFTHSAGVSVSSLPGDVKQAVIHLTSALIKTRGTLSIVAGKLQSAPTKTTGVSAGADKDMNAAQSLLAPYRRVR